MTTSTSNAPKHGVDQGARLATAIDRVVRPFIKLLVGRVSCGFLVQQVKKIYIEEARKWIEKNDRNGRVTKSKLAMLTGLDTRSISSFEESAVSPDEAKVGDICAEAAVLDAWNLDTRYRDDDGQPKILPIISRGVSFQGLVSGTVGRNVTYQTLLERLVESGNVEMEGDDHIRLVNPYYQPVKPSEETIIDAGSLSIGRLTETVGFNLNSVGRPRVLQQDRWSRKIPREKYGELNAAVRTLIDKQILEVERIIDSYEVDGEGKDTCTFGIGWYAFGDKPENDELIEIQGKEF